MATTAAPQPPTPAADPDRPTLVSAAYRIARQLDQRGNPDLHGLPELLLRGLKVQEEAGELAQAVIGALGQNPRKGVTHTWDQVIHEAIDVALSALVFAESVRPGELAALLPQRLTWLRQRAAASGAPTIAQSTGAGPAGDPGPDPAPTAGPAPGRATCLDPGTPLLTADLSWRRLGTLPVVAPPHPAGSARWPLPADDPAVERAMAVHHSRSTQQHDAMARFDYRYAYAYQRTRDPHLLIEWVNSVLASVVLHANPDYDRAVAEFEQIKRASAGKPPVDVRTLIDAYHANHRRPTCDRPYWPNPDDAGSSCAPGTSTTTSPTPLGGEAAGAGPRYARIHVQPGLGLDAWPVVERVPGGWQSGTHHYPDAVVLDIAALPIVNEGERR